MGSVTINVYTIRRLNAALRALTKESDEVLRQRKIRDEAQAAMEAAEQRHLAADEEYFKTLGVLGLQEPKDSGQAILMRAILSMAIDES